MRTRRTGGLLQAVIYCTGLAVVSAAGLGLALIGRTSSANQLTSGWQSRLGPPPRLPDRFGPVAGNAAIGLVFGLLSLIPLLMLPLFVARGICYGWVDPGPYDTSWGGPTLAGAWAAHFAVGAACTAVAVAVLAGIAALHRRWTARLAGAPGGAWVPAVAVLAVAAETLFFIGWLHQL
jgi:hypothetical protein